MLSFTTIYGSDRVGRRCALAVKLLFGVPCAMLLLTGARNGVQALGARYQTRQAQTARAEAADPVLQLARHHEVEVAAFDARWDKAFALSHNEVKELNDEHASNQQWAACRAAHDTLLRQYDAAQNAMLARHRAERLKLTQQFTLISNSR